MKTALQQKPKRKMKQEISEKPDPVKMSFEKIAPLWPLKNLIAVNPLKGLEELPIELALKLGTAYFQQTELPQEMESVNVETIKWLQAFCDEGQATIFMPCRTNGLYASWSKLAVYDNKLHGNDIQKQEWLRDLPKKSEQAIAECLLRLSIAKKDHETFLTLMLITLPGWAGYIKYRTEWAGLDANHHHPVTHSDYIAIRLIITSLLWPEAKALLEWHNNALAKSQTTPIKTIEKSEITYRLPLLEKIAAQSLQKGHIPDAQLVFCIDVRSEPFRRNLEATGNYHTFGFAGFFGIPVQITDGVTGNSYASCPALLTPKHEVKEWPCERQAWEQDLKGYKRVTSLKRIYQSIKYTFITPFALVEGLGIVSGVFMALHSLSPKLASKIKSLTINSLRTPQAVEPSLDSISLKEQCAYAESTLKIMGMTNYFAPVVIFCGHGSTTQNNACATALDCGACGGRHGASNARIIAAILNKAEIRAQLAKKGITIPETTCFVAAEHNTTTDEVTLYGNVPAKIKADLQKAGATNSKERLAKMHILDGNTKDSWLRSQDWAQVRPEWGLARNAAFIVAPRDISKDIDLEGRCFLHSYDYTQDPEGKSLTVILTAPMVVAEWINMQYLFSTIDNVAYGSGSKITKNITGKIGIMQGNASDLMTGLPLQSVYTNDEEPYHEPQRLMCVVYAPRAMIKKIVLTQTILQKLFGNGWVQMACIEPKTHKIYFLGRDLKWHNTL